MNKQRPSGNDMIYVLSSEEPNRSKPREVPRKLKNTAAWKNHKFREVPNPEEPIPQKIAPVPVVPQGPDPRDVLIAELQARLAAAQVPDELPNTPTTDPVTTTPTQAKPEAPKRGPGRPPKTQA